MFRMFEVGGCVRDEILGIKSKDIDFSVESESFDAMRHYLVTMDFEIFLETPEFLTIRARFPRNDEWIHYKGLTADFVLCRKEGAYSDGRHPDEVEVGTLFDDLRRRDFTMNAIAKDPGNSTFIDPHGGIEDIRKRVIRCVGSAEDRFQEDALRALRAIRFAITKEFSMDEEVISALRSDWLPPLLSSVSAERKREELHKMFKKDTIGSMNVLYAMKTPFREAIFCDGLWLDPSLKG